jgi:hypothetical protein
MKRKSLKRKMFYDGAGEDKYFKSHFVNAKDADILKAIKSYELKEIWALGDGFCPLWATMQSYLIATNKFLIDDNNKEIKNMIDFRTFIIKILKEDSNKAIILEIFRNVADDKSDEAKSLINDQINDLVEQLNNNKPGSINSEIIFGILSYLLQQNIILFYKQKEEWQEIHYNWTGKDFYDYINNNPIYIIGNGIHYNSLIPNAVKEFNNAAKVWREQMCPTKKDCLKINYGSIDEKTYFILHQYKEKNIGKQGYYYHNNTQELITIKYYNKNTDTYFVTSRKSPEGKDIDANDIHIIESIYPVIDVPPVKTQHGSEENIGKFGIYNSKMYKIENYSSKVDKYLISENGIDLQIPAVDVSFEIPLNNVNDESSAPPLPTKFGTRDNIGRQVKYGGDEVYIIDDYNETEDEYSIVGNGQENEVKAQYVEILPKAEDNESFQIIEVTTKNSSKPFVFIERISKTWSVKTTYYLFKIQADKTFKLFETKNKYDIDPEKIIKEEYLNDFKVSMFKDPYITFKSPKKKLNFEINNVKLCAINDVYYLEDANKNLNELLMTKNKVRFISINEKHYHPFDVLSFKYIHFNYYIFNPTDFINKKYKFGSITFYFPNGRNTTYYLKKPINFHPRNS